MLLIPFFSNLYDFSGRIVVTFFICLVLNVFNDKTSTAKDICTTIKNYLLSIILFADDMVILIAVELDYKMVIIL